MEKTPNHKFKVTSLEELGLMMDVSRYIEEKASKDTNLSRAKRDCHAAAVKAWESAAKMVRSVKLGDGDD